MDHSTRERDVLHTALRADADCPTIEELGRYADGATSDTARAAVAAHVATCPNCQSEYALLRAFQSVEVRADELAMVREGRERLRARAHEVFGRDAREDRSDVRSWVAQFLRPTAAVAGVLLAMSAGLYLWRPAAPRLPAVVDSGSEITRSFSVTVVGPLGDVRDVPTQMEWRSVSGAVRYRVQMTDVNRLALWTAETQETRIELPAEVRARIVPSKTLLWEVAAYDASNASLGESGSQRFRLTEEK
jgi:Putative zinc-finger